MRRLPVYLLLDTSGSMKGEPIESMKAGLSSLVASLRQDPFALESVHICLITFDKDVKVVSPLESIETFNIPEIQTPDSAPTHTGEALDVLCRRIEQDIVKSTHEVKGDWRPLLFILTDGSPSDIAKYRHLIPEVKKKNFGIIVGCAAGPKAKKEYLAELTDNVIVLDLVDSSTFGKFFKWVSSSISLGNKSMGTSSPITLPPPPPDLNSVVM